MTDPTPAPATGPAADPATGRAGDPAGQRWVVAAWTPDEFGDAAVDAAIREARSRGCGVAVVNGTKGDALVDERYADAGDLASVEERLRGAGLPFVVRQQMGPDVAEQVVRVADELAAELIVVGLRRRSPVGKLLMGSVAQRILLTAVCPVLAVKPATQGL